MVDALSHEQLEPSPFDEPELALLAYTDALTRDPSSVSAADIEKLRAAGWDDRAIHDACTIIAYWETSKVVKQVERTRCARVELAPTAADEGRVCLTNRA